MMTFMTILQRYFEILAGSVPQAAKKAIICSADGYEECSPGRPNTRAAARSPSSLPDLIRQPMPTLGLHWACIGLGRTQR
jgi:hypothetical protein